MFIEYLDKLRAEGKRYFSYVQIKQDLNISDASAKSGIHRLKKFGKIISPLKGLYVIVPPEHRSYGSIPAEELIPIVMQHLETNYYVALLSAASYYGATHQKPSRFQIITSKRIKHSLDFGSVSIELIYKDSMDNLPLKDFIVSTGYLKVASPELIVLDLFKYPKRSGGINHIATVLSELTPSLDVNKLLALADNSGEICQIQRLGYILERIDVMEDEDKKQRIVSELERFVKKSSSRPFVSLVPYITRVGHPRCKKWKIVANTDFESDL